MIESVLGKNIDFAMVKKINEEAKDWEGKCQLCGEELRGTLAEIKAHVCRTK